MNRLKIVPTRRRDQISIPFQGDTTLSVSIGDEVEAGQKLFESNRKKVKDSYYLPKMLGVKIEKSMDYVGRITGEYVSTGDLLAEKLTAAGMLGKRVLAGTDGVVNLDRIHQGYIDILGEEELVENFSKIRGEVVGISLNNYITIESDCGEIDFIHGFNLKTAQNPKVEEISGELVIIEQGDTVYSTSSLVDSYEGKIVFAGRFLYPDLAKEIQKRGATAIITYSTDYESAEASNVPIVVVGGFGQIKLNFDLLLLFQDAVGHLVKINAKERTIVFSNKDKVPGSDDYKGMYYFSGDLEEGNSVISITPDKYGQVGIISEIYRDDEGEIDKVLVQLSSSKRVIFSMDQLDLYVPIV